MWLTDSLNALSTITWLFERERHYTVVKQYEWWVNGFVKKVTLASVVLNTDTLASGVLTLITDTLASAVVY